MTLVQPIASPVVRDVLTTVRDWRWTWSSDEVPALLAQLGWTVAVEVPGGAILAEPPWGVPGLKHSVAMARGGVQYVDIKLSTRAPEQSEQTLADLNDAFVQVIADATAVLGPADESRPGPAPAQRWQLDNGVLTVVRTSWTVGATWADARFAQEPLTAGAA
ncbi:hypothetical protein Cs7R123_13140 [Catellatospora sp. TT07R-123]|uniref:DUF6301 family protein n=1 Tax=Catellatospora sp. TT07R-123 TaxID=2733863 RepID=UPI001B279648|nr:DUF6301 family protein [Catellatospora sp. TT07R-123]GHJ43972.1 hypothetical protein Cs7R123_13140 [Catellatospora sp. TT07R-123]